jgi:hypothetical protein
MPKRTEVFLAKVPSPEGFGHAAFVELGLEYCDRIQAAYGNPMSVLRTKLHEFRDIVCRETLDVVRLRAFCEQIADVSTYSATAFDEVFSYASELLEELTGLRVEPWLHEPGRGTER